MAAPSGVHFSAAIDAPYASSEDKTDSLGSQRGSHNGVDMAPRMFSSKSAKMVGGVELGGPPLPLMHRGSSKFSAASQELSGSDTDDDDAQQSGGSAAHGPSHRTTHGASSAADKFLIFFCRMDLRQQLTIKFDTELPSGLQHGL